MWYGGWQRGMNAGREKNANTAGDSILAEFASVVDTVRCAVSMQQAVAALNAGHPEEQRMWFRIGINVGDIIAKEGDIFGDGVNIAARLQTLATAGGICVSRGVRNHIRHLDAFHFEDLGEQQVKNIAENDKYARHLRASAGVAVFVSQRDDRDHWVRAGRACQRFALQATAFGLKHAFVNQPVEVARLRPELAALVGLPGRRPDIVMRFGYGPSLPFSARRPVEAVLA